MHSYRYRVHVAALTGAKGEPVEDRNLTFEVANHDDILGIAARLQTGLPFGADESAALAIGLKLFAEVALVNRADPLFAKIRPALSEFIGELKKRSAQSGVAS